MAPETSSKKRAVATSPAYAGTGPSEDRIGSRPGLDRLAHEIRTPLAAIQSMAEALAGGHLGRMESERHRAYVASMAETARHALAVMEAMLPAGGSAAAREPAFPVSVDLAALSRVVVAEMAVLAARRGVRLAVGPGRGCPVHAVARATDVRQMLINLVSNGIAHGGAGGTVTLSTGRGDSEAWLEVADDGPGVPEDVLARIEARVPLEAGDVEPSSRMRLGLTLTKALAEDNLGRLELVSGTQGTRARIILRT